MKSTSNLNFLNELNGLNVLYSSRINKINGLK